MSDVALLKLGSVFLRNTQGEKAAKIFKIFIENSPDDFRGHFNLGKALCSRGFDDDDDIKTIERQQEAVESFKRALTLNPNIADAHTSLSALYIKMGNPHAAIEHCHCGLNLEEMNSSCLFNLNIALRQVDKLSDALNCTRSKIPSSTDIPSIHECFIHQQTIPYSASKSIFTSVSCNDALTICIVKWGTKYGHNYVSSLVNSLKKHISHSVNFTIVCFTDKIEEQSTNDDVHYRLLPDLSSEQWTGWWYKAYLFSQESELSGPILYIDLDTIVCSSVDFLIDTVLSTIHILCTPKSLPSSGSSLNDDCSQSKISRNTDTMTNSKMNNDCSNDKALPFFFSCLKASEITNEGRSCGVNSSIMLWNATPINDESNTHRNFMHFMYLYLKRNFCEITKVMYKFDHFLEMMLSDTEGKFEGVLFLQDRFTDKIIDFQRATSVFADSTEISDGYDASIVCFPLQPKPHDVEDLPWIQKYWVSESLDK